MKWISAWIWVWVQTLQWHQMSVMVSQFTWTRPEGTKSSPEPMLTYHEWSQHSPEGNFTRKISILLRGQWVKIRSVENCAHIISPLYDVFQNFSSLIQVMACCNLQCWFLINEPAWNSPEDRLKSWASCQICKIAGCTCAGNAGKVFPATDFIGNC